MGKTPEKGVEPVTYAEIVEGLYLGMNIETQCRACGAGKIRASDHRRAILMKNLRVYNVSSILSGIPCTDLDFLLDFQFHQWNLRKLLNLLS